MEVSRTEEQMHFLSRTWENGGTSPEKKGKLRHPEAPSKPKNPRTPRTTTPAKAPAASRKLKTERKPVEPAELTISSNDEQTLEAICMETTVCGVEQCPGSPDTTMGDLAESIPLPDRGAPGTGYPCPVHRAIHPAGEVCHSFRPDGKRIRHRDLREKFMLAQDAAREHLERLEVLPVVANTHMVQASNEPSTNSPVASAPVGGTEQEEPVYELLRAALNLSSIPGQPLTTQVATDGGAMAPSPAMTSGDGNPQATTASAIIPHGGCASQKVEWNISREG